MQRQSLLVGQAIETGSGPSSTQIHNRQVWRLAGVSALCAVAAGIWMTATLRTVGHGFEITDEGFYLLSYRWWDVSHLTFTGAQYFYGPAFELLGYNIAALRLFRLGTVVGTHVLFGWAFMRWLRLRRPHSPTTRWWEVAGTAAIVAAGGMVYSWLPLSPGYNDISLLGALLAAAIVLRIATNVQTGIRTSAWLAASLGAVAFVMLLSKWSSSVVTLILVGAVGILVVTPSGMRQVFRLTAWTVVGLVGMAAIIHFLVIPLTTVVPPMLSISKFVAGSATHSIGDLLVMYRVSAGNILKTLVSVHWLFLIAGGVAVAARGRVARVFALSLVIAGVIASAWRMVVRGDLSGGNENFEHFPISLLLVVCVVLGLGVCVVLDRRASTGKPSSLAGEGIRGFAILAMVALLPLAQAVGTSNQIHFMAVNGFGAWVAIMIAVLTGIESASPVARWLVGLAVSGAVVLSAIIPTDTQLNHPYRSPGPEETTAIAEGVPALSSVALEPARAEQYSKLREFLEPYITPEGRPVMGFDGLAGVVLALDGRSVGEVWYGSRDPARIAYGVRAECQDREPWWGDRAPILLFNRAIRPNELAVLQSCGLDVATDYQIIAPSEVTMGLTIALPVGSGGPH